MTFAVRHGPGPAPGWIEGDVVPGWSSRTADLTTLVAISLAPAAVLRTVVATRVRTWGTTAAERTRTWPGDELVPDPASVWTNAITVERPAPEVWPWIAQLGQGRGGLYSYDWLENALLADVHSTARVDPALQQPLRVGDRVIRMARYAPHNPIALYEAGRALVLGGVGDSDEQLRTGRPSSTWAFIVEPLDAHRCRLVVRSRVSAWDARLQGPVQFVMQRRMMLGVKQRAEGFPVDGAADIVLPVSWAAAAAAAAVLTARSLRTAGGARVQQAALASLAAVVVEVLLFWDVPMRAPWHAAAPAAGVSPGDRRPCEAVRCVSGGR